MEFFFINIKEPILQRPNKVEKIQFINFGNILSIERRNKKFPELFFRYFRRQNFNVLRMERDVIMKTFTVRDVKFNFGI